MMNNTISLVGAFAIGALLGAFFFGGLWWSTRKGVASDNPALWFFGSLLLRTGAVLAGFHLATGNDWHRALVCLLGFIIARFVVLRLSYTLARVPVAKSETP
jgi:F1F0 ATPase subunit 2